MNALGPMIIEEGIVQRPDKVRTTVRAVILNEKNQVLMVYSKHYDDYTFPGGGLKEEEHKEKALKRELREELGANKIKIKKYIGYLEETKYGLFHQESIYLQKSIYYLVDIDSFGKQKLQHREITHGIKPTWIDVDQAIKHNLKVMSNQKHQAYGLKTVLIREQVVLEKIKEMLNHEKIWNRWSI